MHIELKLPASFDKLDLNCSVELMFERMKEHKKLQLSQLFTGETDQKLGRYTVKHIFTDTVDPNVFGADDKNDKIGSSNSIFYEDDIEIFSRESLGGHPVIILYGDGKTRETTFYTYYNNYVLEIDALVIFDINQKQIRKVCIGPDEFIDFKRVSDKYAIAITRDDQDDSPYTSIISLEDLFFPKESEPHKPYDNARTRMPLTDEFGDKFIPISTTKTGFVVKDIETNELLSDIVTYDDAYNRNFDWGRTSKKLKETTCVNNMLSQIGLSSDYVAKTMIDGNGVCIPVEILPINFIQNMADCQK